MKTIKSLAHKEGIVINNREQLEILKNILDAKIPSCTLNFKTGTKNFPVIIFPQRGTWSHDFNDPDYTRLPLNVLTSQSKEFNHYN